jgi:hypothetical protein
MTRIAAWLAATAVAGALLAGCGSSKSSTTASTTAAPAATTTSGTGATGSGATGLSGAAKTQAIAECKRAIATQTTLPPEAKSKLQGVCDKAANGEREAVQKVAREVCEEVIRNGSIPEGPQKQAVLKACKQSK